MEIKKNEKLSRHCTFNTGGNARFFCEVSSDKDIKKALDFCRENKIPFFVLGEGSNLLISDKGFQGLVIKNCFRGIKKVSENENYVVIKIRAGESWKNVVDFAIKNKLYGIENLSGIPGTAGASAVQNIGAYGSEAKDIILSVGGINAISLNDFLLKNNKCCFEYRNSIFKRNRNLIVTDVYFKFSKKFFPILNYAGLRDLIEEKYSGKITSKNIQKTVLLMRENKLPKLKKYGSAGSFFKNPIIREKKYLNLEKKYPGLPKFVAKNGFVKIPAGYLIDKICGLKGLRKNNVGLYEKQALVLVNYGKATTSEINLFANFVEKKVFEKTGIKMEREVEKIGF